MLFKEIHLKGIRSGQIILAFRRWQRPSVQPGSLLHTSIGLMQINEITKTAEKDIAEEDAINVGLLISNKCSVHFGKTRKELFSE